MEKKAKYKTLGKTQGKTQGKTLLDYQLAGLSVIALISWVLWIVAGG